jgi:hypothetical protein
MGTATGMTVPRLRWFETIVGIMARPGYAEEAIGDHVEDLGILVDEFGPFIGVWKCRYRTLITVFQRLPQVGMALWINLDENDYIMCFALTMLATMLATRLTNPYGWINQNSTYEGLACTAYVSGAILLLGVPSLFRNKLRTFYGRANRGRRKVIYGIISYSTYPFIYLAAFSLFLMTLRILRHGLT